MVSQSLRRNEEINRSVESPPCGEPLQSVEFPPPKKTSRRRWTVFRRIMCQSGALPSHMASQEDAEKSPPVRQSSENRSFRELNGFKHPFNPNTASTGKKWLKLFLRRHSNVTSRKSQNLNPARAQKLNRFIVNDHFEKLKTGLGEGCSGSRATRVYPFDTTAIPDEAFAPSLLTFQPHRLAGDNTNHGNEEPHSLQLPDNTSTLTCELIPDVKTTKSRKASRVPSDMYGKKKKKEVVSNNQEYDSETSLSDSQFSEHDSTSEYIDVTDNSEPQKCQTFPLISDILQTPNFKKSTNTKAKEKSEALNYRGQKVVACPFQSSTIGSKKTKVGMKNENVIRGKIVSKKKAVKNKNQAKTNEKIIENVGKNIESKGKNTGSKGKKTEVTEKTELTEIRKHTLHQEPSTSRKYPYHQKPSTSSQMAKQRDESWYSHICKTGHAEDMRLCNLCLWHVHEALENVNKSGSRQGSAIGEGRVHSEALGRGTRHTTISNPAMVEFPGTRTRASLLLAYSFRLSSPPEVPPTRPFNACRHATEHAPVQRRNYTVSLAICLPAIFTSPSSSSLA
ncbi:hypothetical protein PR048_012532 [Dryococelus australis]|uniref:Uncharacterized protein n=1 Tax=Dryococelus australis TaxID=614101 RepID=A0ABQ9HPN3_9NEOP|nr:hypothetical protein PR048_012532 [Dryococelus australis]